VVIRPFVVTSAASILLEEFDKLLELVLRAARTPSMVADVAERVVEEALAAVIFAALTPSAASTLAEELERFPELTC